MSSRVHRKAFRSQKRRDLKIIKAAPAQVKEMIQKGDNNGYFLLVNTVNELCLKYGKKSPLKYRRV